MSVAGRVVGLGAVPGQDGGRTVKRGRASKSQRDLPGVWLEPLRGCVEQEGRVESLLHSFEGERVELNASSRRRPRLAALSASQQPASLESQTPCSLAALSRLSARTPPRPRPRSQVSPSLSLSFSHRPPTDPLAHTHTHRPRPSRSRVSSPTLSLSLSPSVGAGISAVRVEASGRQPTRPIPLG